MFKEDLFLLWQQNDSKQFRNFGTTMAVVFFIVSFYLWYTLSDLSVFFLSISILFLLIGRLKPGMLRYVFYIWMSFAILLGSIMSRLVLSLLFLTVFTPTGIVMRLFRKDPLNRTIQTEKKSYWIKRDRSFDRHSLEKQY